MMKLVKGAVLAGAGWLAMASAGAAAEHPWTVHQGLLKTVIADVKAKGVAGIGPHAADIETIMKTASSASVVEGDTTYAFADGPAAALFVSISAATAAAKPAQDGHLKQTVAVENPYPALCFFLGSYYNEAGRPLDALRVLDRGLELDLALGVIPGEMTAITLVERNASLVSLHRWPEMLEGADRGLKLSGLDGKDKARLLRGRGFALVELGRLDEAEKAYLEARTSDPSDQRAPQELAYIARLKAGAAPVAPKIALPGGQPH